MKVLIASFSKNHMTCKSKTSVKNGWNHLSSWPKQFQTIMQDNFKSKKEERVSQEHLSLEQNMLLFHGQCIGLWWNTHTCVHCHVWLNVPSFHLRRHFPPAHQEYTFTLFCQLITLSITKNWSEHHLNHTVKIIRQNKFIKELSQL